MYDVPFVGTPLVQFGLVAAVAASFIVAVVMLARRQKISFQYAIGWLVLLIIALFSGLLVPVVEPVATAAKLSPVAVILAISVVILLAVCIQLSISISGLQRQVRRLHEEVAFLKQGIDSRDHEV